MFKKKQIALALMSVISAPAFAAPPAGWVSTVTPQTWTTTIDPSTYNAMGTITFNDWGYQGPSYADANTFQIGSGFDSGNIGQMQHVVTVLPDWNTPDPTSTILGDLDDNPTYSNANMDGNVNFWNWGYTTPAGSQFNNMQIDKAGNYFIARDQMQFGYYDTFLYKDMANPTADPQSIDTSINFQPYPISDAMGWCGSVLNQNPNGVAQMAGQVTFDFAFDAYLGNQPSNTTDTPATQIVPGFVMRSYGEYVVNVSTLQYLTDEEGNPLLDENGNPLPPVPGVTQSFSGSAVGNNFNPVTGQLDPAYQNKVSFLGAGVVPIGVWVFNDGSRTDVTVADVQGPNGTADGEVRADGATWHINSFAGYAYILRADGIRILDYVNPTGHSNYVATVVPVPAAAWLFGSGLLGLFGIARRKIKYSA